jgi:signal transduction histidine kinase
VLADLTHIRAVERVREEFAADCSGDLRTFASAISTYAGHALRRVRRANADTTLVHQLEGIIRNARQVSNLVGDLLDAGRVEVGGGELAPSEVDLVPLVEQAIDQARAMTTRHRFRLDVPASLPPAYCDPNLVRRALVNVLSNAIKYWPDGGQIGVRVRPQLDGIFISVRDRGLGIPPDRLERVFERFFRVVDDPARRGIRGNGLGLYLVREVIEAHGGTAWIESTGVAGEPTTVHLLLPWRPAPSDDRA